MSKARIFLLAELTFLIAVFCVAMFRGETEFPFVEKEYAGALGVVRNGVIDAIEMRFPDPHASIVSGLLLGADEKLSKSVRDQFRASGLSHILAVSGYNTTILATMFESILVGIGLGRRATFPAVVTMLLLFVLLTGAEPSVIRAAMMGFLVLLSRRVGRPTHGWYALTFAATVMVVAQPDVLFSVGFQLSFLATAGLMSISPFVLPVLKFLPEKFGVRETAAASVGATVMTTPLVAFRFGTVPVFGIIANLIVVPLVPVSMLFGAIATLPGIGTIARVPATFLVSWMILVADWFSRLPKIVLPV